jgi:alpha-beta hydrolase superfamily lysophospholipase
LAESPASHFVEAFEAGDGYVWRYRRYPAESPRGHVVCLHGIQSHGGWYDDSCTRLSQAGYHVSFLDRRGSGLNERDRGDAPSFRRLIDDVAEFLRGLQPGRSDCPVSLLGISWGGKTATALLRRHPGLVDGLALLCPGFIPQVRPPLGQRLRILTARVVAPRRRFPIPLNDPELFTATPRWQEFIRNDPLALREATARLLVESVRLDAFLRFVPRFVTVPVLLMSAGRDRIIHNQRTRAFVERFATTDREVVEYPEAHHTLEFEPDPTRFVGDLLAWLHRRR